MDTPMEIYEDHPLAYRYPLAEKRFHMKDLADIPAEAGQYFDEFSIRIHEDRDFDSFVFLTVMVPQFKDDEGFIWEKSLLPEAEHRGDGDFYSIPLGDSTPEQLLQNIRLGFEFVQEKRSEKFLLMKARIDNTSFMGYALFDLEELI